MSLKTCMLEIESEMRRNIYGDLHEYEKTRQRKLNFERQVKIFRLNAAKEAVLKDKNGEGFANDMDYILVIKECIKCNDNMDIICDYMDKLSDEGLEKLVESLNSIFF